MKERKNKSTSELKHTHGGESTPINKEERKQLGGSSSSAGNNSQGLDNNMLKFFWREKPEDLM
jgi:hypothetical protein